MHTLQVTYLDNSLSVALFKRGSTLQQYHDVPISMKDIMLLSKDVIRLLNQSCELLSNATGLNDQIKRIGHVFYEQIIPPNIKDQLKEHAVQDLHLVIEEGLVFIPWELFYDGEDFFSLKYNMGRSVITRQTPTFTQDRRIGKPIKMLILADPCNDLPAAREECQSIRKEFNDNQNEIQISSKTKNITVNYIHKHMKDYDVVHFAGHTVFEVKNKQKTGWKMVDGIFNVNDIEKLDHNSPMPVLIFSNSCQSAYGHHQGDLQNQVYGMANALILKGVKCFVGALWKVPDDKSAKFSQSFYKYMSEGKTIAESLRTSRQSIMNKYHEHNLVWASYIYYGEPNQRVVYKNRNKQKRQLLYMGVPCFILILIVLLSSRWIHNHKHLNTQSIEQARLSIRDKVKANGKDQVISMIQYGLDNQSLQQQYVNYILLADVFALEGHYTQSIEAAQRTIVLANQLKNADKILQSSIFLADKIKEHCYYLSLFSDNDVHKEREINKALNLYRAQLKNSIDKRVLGYAYKGIGDLYKLKNDPALVISHYQQAIDSLSSVEKVALSNRNLLADMHIDMAIMNVQSTNDFNEALQHLKNANEYITPQGQKQAISHAHRTYYLGKYDVLLDNISQAGFANSMFHKKIIQMKEQL